MLEKQAVRKREREVEKKDLEIFKIYCRNDIP
jgi:hypothetical protein